MKKHLSQTMLFVLAVFMVLPFVTSCKKNVINPTLEVSADTLIFNKNDRKDIYLSTKSAMNCTYKIESIPNWICVSPVSGNFSNSSTERISVTSDITSLGLGTTVDRMIVKSNIGYRTITLVARVGNLSYSINEELFVGSDTESATLNIKNTGNIDFAYSVEAATDHITLPSNTSGTLVPYQGTDITVSIDKEAIIADHTEPSLNVNIDGTVVNVPIVFERKQMLSKDIVDAEYSKAKDIMVYVASDLTLNIYHAANKTTDVVTLSYIPTCVSISLDGTKAVVGHDAHVTYIDLETKQILTENDISCYALDVVLGSNGWAYAFPKRDQWEDIRCIDVTIPNSIEKPHTGSDIYAGAVAKLHPSGKYIYDAENGLSSMSMDKFDIQNGVANYLHSLSFDYYAGGDLWFSESGDRIFTKNGNVFKSSEIQELDLMYNGKINLESGSYSTSIKYLDHLELNKSLYIISKGGYYDPNPPFLYICNSDNLTFKSKKALESYHVTDSYGVVTVYPAEPYFVFANSNGEEVYVITKAVGSGLVLEWAIQELYIGQ